MAKKREPTPKQIQNQFKPGQVANPNGGRRLPGPVKATRSISNEQVMEIGAILLDDDMTTLKQVVTDPKASILKKWTATVILKSMAKGDVRGWQEVLNRVVGKVKERVEISEAPKSEIQRKMETMTPEQKSEFLKQAVSSLKDILDE